MRMLMELVSVLAVRGLLYGTVVIGMIFLFRRILRRSPRRVIMWLWLPLLLLLISPILPEIAVPLPDAAQAVIGTDAAHDVTMAAAVDTGVTDDSGAIVSVQDGAAPETDVRGYVSYRPDAKTAAALVWLCGAAGMFVWQAVQHWRVRRMCRNAVLCTHRGRIAVYEVEALRTPFVRGMLMPKIYLPAGMPQDAQTREMILLHETVHVRRFDVLWRYCYTAALCLYWFQPLLWLVRRSFLSDSESACDECVLAQLGGGRTLRAQYAQALLDYASPKTTGVPIAFGMTEMEERVKQVLYPNQMRAGGVIGILAAVMLMGCTVAVTPEFPGTEGVLTTAVTADIHTAVISVVPTSEMFGFVEGYIEEHPDIWGPFTVTAEMPVGWTLSAVTPVTGDVLNADGETVASYAISAFTPIDSPEIPPENIPPAERRWEAIYSHLRLSMMQNVSDEDYVPVVSGERFENAVALMYYAIPEEGVPAAAWEHDRAPLVLAFNQDCSAYLQMTFTGGPVSEERLRVIAESITFTKEG